MPSFLARGLARYIAASYMASSSSSSSDSPFSGEGISKGIKIWNKSMRWLIPFVQATGYRVVIENPKSHETIVIDKDTPEFPRLTSEWLKRYNKQEVIEWMAKEKEREIKRRIEEKSGRERFGDSYTAAD
ncbi:MAG: hypothetical protein IKH05_04175 [Bacteroidaceae bacterium]|nr:hypothetical protein [Bacteroidaceae bacterium]